MTPISLLQKLISIPSISPMGRPLEGDEYFEHRMSDYLVEYFESLDIPHERVDVADGRSNVVARFDGSADRPTILLDAHQDTVPVEGMVIEPFDPVVRDGRIYGRGACDVKGGMVAMLGAVERMVREKPQNRATVIMACTCDEEFGQQGVKHVTKHIAEGSSSYSLLEKAPDAAIIAEPTELDVIVAHRGSTRWKLKTHGRAAHSSDPSKGISAIYQMGRLVQVLEEYAGKLQSESTPHPLCGPPTMSVGLIEGGTSVNIVPAECTIEIDRRVIPGEDATKVMQPVEDFLRERLDFDFEMLPPYSIGLTLPDDHNGELADGLVAAAEKTGRSSEKLGVPFGTHASRYAAVGVPSVVFGPGSIAQAHTKDEWLEVEQLNQAVDVLYEFLTSS